MGQSLLLCEVHAHSTWSDGELSVPELVDLYGESGFDVLCITDHVRPTGASGPQVARDDWYAYVNEIDREAERARRKYGLLLIPGAELTDEHDDPRASAHVLALGVRTWIALEDGLVEALHAARADGAALVGAHPYRAGDKTSHRPTQRLARDARTFVPLIDRWELFNRNELFAWVAERDLRAVASGDFHRLEHFASWKTLLPSEPEEHAVIEFLRSDARSYVVPWQADLHLDVRVAA